MLLRSLSPRRIRSSWLCATSTYIFGLGFLLVFLICTYKLLLRLERETHIQSKGIFPSVRSPVTRPALVTMADSNFHACALQLIKSARKLAWKDAIFLLTVDYDKFDATSVEELDRYGVFIVHTNSIFDRWIDLKMDNTYTHHELDKLKMRKMELFLNPIFRTYDRLIYIDADGLLGVSLEPMVTVRFPESTVVLMRQNDRSVGKGSMWDNEINETFLTTKQKTLLLQQYPDRDTSGASCWFIVDVSKLESPAQLFSKCLKILCNFRAGFKLNDQTLLNLLFYDRLSIFPWCVWDEIPIMDNPGMLKRYCSVNMRLQRWINGKLTFLYRHMAVAEKKLCVRPAGAIGATSMNGKRKELNLKPRGTVDLNFPKNNNMTCRATLKAWQKKLSIFKHL